MPREFQGTIELDVRESTGDWSAREGIGPLRRYIDDQMVAQVEIRTVMRHFSLCGEGACIGCDSASATTAPIRSPRCTHRASHSSGGTIKKVVFDIADDAYIDVEAHLGAAMARD